MRKSIKALLTLFICITLIFSTPLSSFAYYCTANCYNVCGDGNCNLNMSCPSDCDGHHASPCWIVESYPTCTTSGRVLVQHCTAVAGGFVCHERDVWQVLPALGHAFGAYICDDSSTHHRTCSRCGYVETDNHHFCPKYPIAYKDNGDTHITTYRHDCYQCGYSEIWTEIENHVYSEWEREDGADTATRKCIHCAHMQHEWIGIEIDPLSDDTNEDWTNEVLFVAKDACDCLGINNSRQALTRLDADEKDVISTDTLGGKQSLSYVSESGLYMLIMGSRKK